MTWTAPTFARGILTTRELIAARSKAQHVQAFD
jgi:hypothetical protein